MTLLRGRGLGLEVLLAGRDFDTALTELQARFAEKPGFYNGVRATISFGSTVPTDGQLEALRQTLDEGGLNLQGISGAPGLESVAEAFGVAFTELTPAGEDLARRRALRPKREVNLSDGARSLVADFAGARADIAERRKRGETSVRRTILPEANTSAPAPQQALQLVEPAAGTLYHVGTLRGGQALHHVGNIVVIGDVNPGTELVASRDVVVFGRLLGVAHAGAQGDADARVYALHLDATQLRIASCIAANEGPRKEPAEPEVAIVSDNRIIIVPLDKAGDIGGL